MPLSVILLCLLAGDVFGCEPAEVSLSGAGQVKDSMTARRSDMATIFAILSFRPVILCSAHRLRFHQSPISSSSIMSAAATSGADVPRSLLFSHPELNVAVQTDGQVNPVEGALIMFDDNDGALAHHAARPSPATPRRAASSQRLRLDPSTPYVLSLYLQLIFNAILVSLIAFLIFTCVTTIRSDINRKTESHTAALLEEISRCTREYHRNRCLPEQRAPMLEQACTKWARCMNMDPQSLARSKITAETLADAINGFVRPILWKAIVFVNVMIWGSLAFTNVAFGRYRETYREHTRSIAL